MSDESYSPSLELAWAGRRYRTGGPVDLAIPLDPGGPQPRHFDAPAARVEPMHSGDFVGDTARGAGCNVPVLTLNPHCNGTHTECLGHISDPPRPVADVTGLPPMAAVLVTLERRSAGGCAEQVDPDTTTSDAVLTADDLGTALDGLDADVAAVVVRTLPNPPGKRFWSYGGDRVPPCFTVDAMHLLAGRGVRHLVCDLPSVDRMHDGGRLLGHRAFWGLAAGATDAASAGHPEATITELAYVPDEIEDGLYLLDLQVARFLTDAAPSRPILYPLHPLEAAR